MFTWELRDEDCELFHRELEAFTPGHVYDVHAHLYQTRFWDQPDPQIAAGPAEVSLDVWHEQMEWLFPGRDIHGVHLPLAFVPDTKPGNQWVAQQIRQDPRARGHFLVRPTDEPEWVRQEVKRLGLHGLKPFSSYARVADIWEAEIPDYLPESIAAIAHQEGWTVTLHIVRPSGIADASNQHWIRHYCRSYPGMNIILDHCARGFNPYQVIDGLCSLKGLDNLWIDTSAVTSSLAVEAALRILGPARVMYGSDYCISHFRATTAPAGDDFVWLSEDNAVWQATTRGRPVNAPLVGMENLRAIKAACWVLGLSDSQIEDFFWGNATHLFGVES